MLGERDSRSLVGVENTRVEKERVRVQGVRVVKKCE